MRTSNAERVIHAAWMMLMRSGAGGHVDPRALEWARLILAANRSASCPA